MQIDIKSSPRMDPIRAQLNLSWTCSIVVKTHVSAGDRSISLMHQTGSRLWDQFVRKRSAISQPTKPTLPSVPPGPVTEQQLMEIGALVADANGRRRDERCGLYHPRDWALQPMGSSMLKKFQGNVIVTRAAIYTFVLCYGGRGSRQERVAVLRHGLFNDIRLQASLKNVPLCEVPVLTATLLRSRRAVSTLFSVLEAVRCTTL